MHQQATIVMMPPTGLAIHKRPDGTFGNSHEEKYFAFYQQDPEKFQKTALEQWQSLVDLYESWGAKVIIGVPTPGLHDQPYTADPGIITLNEDDKEITIFKSHFKNATRQDEVIPFIQLIKEAHKAGFIAPKDYTIREYQMRNYFEGTGDCYHDKHRNMMFAGYTNTNKNSLAAGRSSLEAHKELQEQTGIDVISLNVTEPCFHIDTCLAPLSDGYMLVYKDGITDESYDHLVQKAFIDKGLDPDEYLIQVSENDAVNNFVTNMQCVGKNIAMPQFEDEIDGETIDPIAPALLKRLADIGYKVTTLNYSHMIMAGGAMHCTSHLVPSHEKSAIINQPPQEQSAFAL